MTPQWPMEKIQQSLMENYFFYLSEFYQDSPHVEVQKNPNLHLLISDLPDSRFNIVFKSMLANTNLAEHILDVRKIYSQKRVPFSWIINPQDTPANLGDELERKGFKFLEILTGMNRILTEPKPSDNYTLQFKQASNTRELLDYANPLAKIGVPDLFAKTLETLPEKNFIGSPFEVYVGYHKSHPVVSGLFVNYAAVGGIYNCVGAYDEALREKYEDQMMKYLLNRAYTLKLPYAVTVTHLPQDPLYQQNNFHGCMKFSKYVLSESQ